jgi:signal recognition particle receptor subunit beta
MALINHAKREINAKLVFYGPGLSGKATNLNYIYRKLKPEHRGKLKTMNIQKDRMMFFDFAPPGQGKVGGYNVRFHIYSLSGEVANSAVWKLVLKGADGILLIADSAPDRMAANMESLHNLQRILSAYGKNLAGLPGVLQCNKRDLAAAVPLEEMQRSLNPGRYAVMPAVAGRGEGVLDSLFSLVKMVLKNLRESGLELENEPVQLAGLAATTKSASAEEPIGMEPLSYAGAEEFPEVSPPAGETAPASAPIAEVAGADGEEPVITIAGAPEAVAGGSLRLPLSVRYGGREKKVAITVTVTLELDEKEE